MSHSIAKVTPDQLPALEQGLDSFREKRWGSAFVQLSSADREAPIEPEHLVQLGQAALLLGKETEEVDALARAHQGFLALKKTTFAVRCAFWLGFMALLNGEPAKAGGWLSRAARLLEGCPECVEHGYMMMPGAYHYSTRAILPRRMINFQEAVAVARQFGDVDLMTLALQGQGRALIRRGKPDSRP